MTIKALIRVVDKTDKKNAINDAWLTKAGDWIVVYPDTWVWSKEELNNPDWICARIIGMSFQEGLSFTAEQSGDIKITPKLKRRAKGLNFAQLSQAISLLPRPLNYVIDLQASDIRLWAYVKPIDNSLVL